MIDNYLCFLFQHHYSFQYTIMEVVEAMEIGHTIIIHRINIMVFQILVELECMEGKINYLLSNLLNLIIYSALKKIYISI